VLGDARRRSAPGRDRLQDLEPVRGDREHAHVAARGVRDQQPPTVAAEDYRPLRLKVRRAVPGPARRVGAELRERPVDPAAERDHPILGLVRLDVDRSDLTVRRHLILRLEWKLTAVQSPDRRIRYRGIGGTAPPAGAARRHRLRSAEPSC
jgi:hypothetical protein